MATAVEDVEYESDPEEATRSLALRRRRAASDDEGDEGEVREEAKADRRAPIHSEDEESEDQGGAAEYDDDEDELLDDDEEEIDYEEEAEREGYVERGPEGEAVMVLKELEGGEGAAVDENGEKEGGGDEGEKKENEPFAVPTAGAFYMHDDRFRDNSGGGRGRYDYS